MAGRILAVAQQKGGSGKTTLAAHLAVAATSEGRSVAAIDMDPQGSFAAWAELRAEMRAAAGETGPGFDLLTIAGWRIAAETEPSSRAAAEIAALWREIAGNLGAR